VLDRNIMIMVNILALAQVKILIIESISFLLAVLNIEILGILIMELILHNHHRHITLMIDPLTNHLSLLDQPNIHIIILVKTIYLISLLSARMITMMISCLIAIQCGNDYIMQVFMNAFCEMYYIHVFSYVSTGDACIYAFSLYLLY